MRNDYIQSAAEVISDPYILVNVVSRRVKQLRRGARPLISSLEKLSLEDIALREIAERKISYEIATAEELRVPTPPVRAPGIASGTMGRPGFGGHNVLVGAKQRTA
ncbi:MAG: DNA-directed RNA polymerase subunit omega [Opitutae bacterium]|nr:DNA-directed RNA polymerase subunit omega [Opitutae bacterium]